MMRMTVPLLPQPLLLRIKRQHNYRKATIIMVAFFMQKNEQGKSPKQHP